MPQPDGVWVPRRDEPSSSATHWIGTGGNLTSCSRPFGRSSVRVLDGKRVLLTGGSGFIGTNLVDLLIECGADVVSADTTPPPRHAHGRLWRRCDVRDKRQL